MTFLPFFLMAKQIVVSAPGKVILFGEHAVVYPEHPAVASAIDLKTTVVLEEIERPEINIELEYFKNIFVFQLADLDPLRASISPGIHL